MTTTTKAQQQQQQQQAPAPAVQAPAVQGEGDLLEKSIAQASDMMDQIAQRYLLAIQDTPAPLRRAMLLADGLDKLRSAITPQIMKRIMGLMNSQLGFKTDRPNRKENTPYPEAVVKECVIEGLLRGVFPVQNELNIIAGRCYVTKEGYQRKVKEIEGLTDLQLMPGIPRVDNGRTVVRYGARWKLHGQPQQLVDAEGKPGRVFAIIAYESATADNILGKATRKALKAIYDQATGSEHSLSDDEIEDVTEPPSPSNGAQAPPTGRVSLRPTGQTPPAPQPEAEAPASESLQPEQPAAEERPAEVPAVAPPDQDAMALEDLLSDLHEQLAAAKTPQEMTAIGAALHEHQEWMGEFNYQALLQKFQERYRQLQATERRRPGPGEKPK